MNQSRDLIRSSGLALLLTAIIYPIYTLLHPSEETPSAILASPWAAIHSLWVVGTLLMLLGLVGLHARQAEQSGRLGVLGFVMSFVGTALLFAIAFFDSYIVPVLAANAPAVIDPQGPISMAPTFMGLFVITVVFLFGGAILFGIAIFRAAVLPRWGGVLFALGVPLFTGGQGFGPVWGTVCALVLSTGLAWLGLALWSGQGLLAQPSAPALGEVAVR